MKTVFISVRAVFSVLVIFLSISVGQSFSQSTNSSPDEQFEKAVELYINAEEDEAYNLFEGLSDHLVEENEWDKLAEVLSYKLIIKRNNRELEASKNLIDELEKVLYDHLDQGHILYTLLYNSRAYEAEINLDHETAIGWAEKSVGLAESFEEEYKHAVRSYATLGYILDSKGDYNAAIEAYQKGVDKAQNIADQTERYYSLTLVYNNLGVAYRRSGNPRKAMEYYETNREYLEKIYHSEHPEIAMNYNNMGAIYYGTGDIGRAAQYFVRAANILEQNYGRNNQHVAAAYNNAGTCYFRLDEIDEAIRYLEIAQEIKINLLGTDHLDTAIGHSNLASIYMNREDYDQALENYNKSLNIRTNNFGSSHPNLINPYIQRSTLFLEIDEPYKALSDIREVLHIARRNFDDFHPGIIEAFLQSGHAHRKLKEYEAALGNYQQAILRLVDNFNSTDFHKNPDDLNTSHPILLLNTLSSKSDIMAEYYLLNRDITYLETAHQTNKKAIKLIGELQTKYQHEVSKLNLLGENFSIFEGSLNTAYNLYQLTGKNEYKKDLFSFIEQSKARIASELFHETEAREIAGVPDDVIETERENNAKIADLHQKLTLEKEKGDDQNEARIRELQDSLFKAHKIQEEWFEMVEEEYPAYYEIKYAKEIPSLEDVQQNILSDDMIVLNYLLGEENLFLMTISSEDAAVYRLEMDIDISSEIDHLRTSIANRETDNYTSTAIKLYDQLFRPFEDQIAGFHDLLIIPDHVLHYLPFELLLREPVNTKRADQWPFLIHDHHISYAPSLMVYENMSNRDAANTNNLLALAPYINNSLGLIAEAGIRDFTEGLSPLPITRYETEEIAKIFLSQRRFWNILEPRRNVTVLQNGEASIGVFNNLELKDFGYIHFATHAFIHESSPSLSGILLSGDDQGDNIIFLGDIYNLQLNADLVVLSACDTGIGSLARGEGMIGFTRAFIHSGVHNLMVSMWKVGDRSASELMIRFYREMFNGAGKTEALRRAKLSLIERPDTAFPSEWASFVLIGR
jgi:CHAT domain-containing protein/Tfp pilus assembly protein PilF